MQVQQPAVPSFRIVRTGRLAWVGRRWLGLSFIGVSIVAVLYLAWRSTQPTPQTPAEAGVATLVIGVSNVLGAYAFSRIGTVSPEHARSSVRRLVTIAKTLTIRYRSINAALDGGTDRAKIIEASIISAEVGTAILGITDAINDWNEVHPEALVEVLRDA
jgi:hypothetical protein